MRMASFLLFSKNVACLWLRLLQVAMPLLFQGHVELLEEYLSRSREQQLLFVQLVDQLIDSETNIDAIVRCCSHCLCRCCLY